MHGYHDSKFVVTVYQRHANFFNVSVTRVLAETTCSSSLLVQDNQSGLIQSNTQTNYYSNMNCSWTITSNAKLELVFFGTFTTESNRDFVYVYDGSSSSARLIGRFTGSSRPAPIVSSSNQLHVRFTSDGSVEYNRFKAVYRGIVLSSVTTMFQFTAHRYIKICYQRS